MNNKKIVSSIMFSSIIATSFSQVFAEEMMHTMSDSSSMMASSISNSLSIGSRGNDVVTLQTFLEEGGYLMIPTGVSKGYFGPLTQNALAKFQSKKGLPSYGYFGPMTMAVLKNESMVNGDTMTSTTMTTSSMMNDSMKHESMMTNDGVMVGGAMMIQSRDIVDNAVLASNVTTVVAAVKAAGLVDTLKSAGPFTVFAPDNAAFNKLPAGTVDSLLKPENKAKLTSILTHHVVMGRYKTSDLYDGQILTTVEGQTLKISKDSNGIISINGSVMIKNANVISSNGVTHVIDTVLLPQ